MLVSALLFNQGRLSWLRPCWQQGQLTPVLAEPTAHDQVFLDLALAAATPVLVTGDADLLALQETVRALQILTPANFHSWLAAHT